MIDRCIEWVDNQVRILDQTRLPNEIYFIDMKQLDRLPAGQYFLRYRDGARKGTLTLVK